MDSFLFLGRVSWLCPQFQSFRMMSCTEMELDGTALMNRPKNAPKK